MKLRKHPDAFECDLGGSVILFNAREGKYFQLNEVGGAIWRMLSEPLSVDEIAAALCERYDVEEAVCRSSVSSLTLELLGEKLLAEG